VPDLLFVSYSGAFGGAERVLIDCADAVAGDHILLCPEGPLAQRARADGLRVLPLRARSLLLRAGVRERLQAAARLAAHARELDSAARNLEPDLIVAWGMRSALAGVWATRTGQARFAFSHHDFLPGGVIGSAVRAAAGRAAAVIACSQAVADDLDPGGRLDGRLHVVHPGVDPELFGPAGDARTPTEVLVLGALTRWKRPDLALEICALVRRDLPGLRLRFVGAPVTEDAPLLTALRERATWADLRGAVDFSGAHSDPRSDLAGAACLLHCAAPEPFGIALLEALATGRPVIAADCGGPREILDASCGRLYPPGDAHAGAAALGELLAAPGLAASMGAAGRERIKAHFDRSRTRAGFAAAIEPLLGRRRRWVGGPAPSAELMQSKQVTLVTVTHNSERELVALMDSVDRHLPGARLIVVDCDSSDASLTAARQRPWVTALELGQNLGFGRSCNRGLREVRTPITALLNPDVELIDDSLLGLVSGTLAIGAPERLLAPLVLSPDGTRQDTVHPAPASAADLFAALLPIRLIPGAIGAWLAPWRARKPRSVGWAIGAALVARTETLLRLGPFDESIFMYGEDLELGLRATREGVQTWFCPDARVLHHRAHSTRTAYAGEPFERLARARHDVIARALGPSRARLDDRAQAVTFASRLAVKRMLGRPAERERRQLAAVLCGHGPTGP